MATNRPSTLEFLEEQVAHLKAELAQAQAALRAAREASPATGQPISSAAPKQQKAKTGVRWTTEAIGVYREAGPDAELGVDDVCARLVAKGIPAEGTRARNNVQTALARSEGKTLKRVSPGVYKLLEGDESPDQTSKPSPAQGFGL